MNQTRTVRLPVHVVKEINTVRRVTRELSALLRREPSIADLAQRLEKPASEVHRLLRLVRKRAISGRATTPDSDQISLRDDGGFGDRRARHNAEASDVSQHLGQWIEQLP